MKRNMVLVATLLISVAILIPLTVGAEACPLVTIDKEPRCWDDPSGTWYSSNPPYYLGTKYYWWLKITVTAETDLSDYRVVVYDRLGAEFMIEGICTGEAAPQQPDLPEYPSPFPEDDPRNAPFDYTFDYDGLDTMVSPIPPGQPVSVDGASGFVNKTGVTFGSEPYAFDIFWTGTSCKVHFMWTIGPMEEGDSVTTYLIISTDINPGGHQEFTSPCTTYLNSGATVKVLREHRRPGKWVPIYSASTDPIPIEVEEHEV